MLYRISFPTQQSIEFWARAWEFDQHSTRKIRCWGGEDKKIPSVDILMPETPEAIYDNHGRTVWTQEKGMVTDNG